MRAKVQPESQGMCNRISFGFLSRSRMMRIASRFFFFSPAPLIHSVYFQSGEDRLDVVARDFRVTDSRGDLLFAANRKAFLF